MEKTFNFRRLIRTMLFVAVLCLTMALMPCQASAAGYFATFDVNGTIIEVYSHNQFEDALEAIDDLGQDTYATITLNRDITERVPELDKYRIDMTINLNGHTWTIADSTSMESESSIHINGGGGTIKFSKDAYPSGLFCIYGANAITAKDTNFVDCHCGRYPIFYVEANVNGRVELSNCSFENCSSTAYGGVIYVYRIRDIIIDSCSFSNCHSTYGGVFYVEDSCGEWGNRRRCTINAYNNGNSGKTTFSSCSAERGGILYIDNSSVNFFMPDGGSIQSCSADWGGAVYNDSSSEFSMMTGDFSGKSPDHIRSNIIGCKANNDGGFCYSEGKTDIWHQNVQSCSARNGGFLYMNNNMESYIFYSNIRECNATGNNGSVICCWNTVTSEPCELVGVEITDKVDGRGSVIMCAKKILTGDSFHPSTIITNNKHAISNGGESTADFVSLVSFNGEPLGFTLSSGNWWIIGIGAVVILGGLAAIVIVNKKKKAAV